MYEGSRDIIAEIFKSEGAERRTDAWPSTVTSVDVKLAYDEVTDDFVGVLIGDINANPEGIALVHAEKKPEGDVVRATLDAYLSNLTGSDLDLVVTLSEQVYDPSDGFQEGKWLTRNRRALFEALANHPRVASIEPASCSALDVAICTRDGQSTFESHDGYVNFHDLGSDLLDSLNRDISLMARGANAPTALWTPELEATGKDILFENAEDIKDDVGRIRTPRNSRIQTFPELERFRGAVDGPVFLKGPFGTYGDEVVEIRSEENASERITAKENQVRELREWSDFSIGDGERFAFERPDRVTIEYALVEEAIVGTFGEDDRYRTVDYEWNGDVRPIDFVPLAVRANDGVAVPSVLVRFSSKSELNANASAQYTTLESLERSFDDPVDVDHPDAEVRVDLLSELEAIAGRSVDISEIWDVMGRAGTVALAARIASALQAEQSLQ